MMKKHAIMLAAVTAASVLFAEAAPTGKTTITANSLEYDHKEGMINFEGSVKIVDPQYTMTADRMIVMLEGTNDVKQVRAIGKVYVENEDRSAACPEAVYTRADGKIVMSGSTDTSVHVKRTNDDIYGRKITIWLGSEQIECVPARLILDQASVGIDEGTAKKVDSAKKSSAKGVAK